MASEDVETPLPLHHLITKNPPQAAFFKSPNHPITTVKRDEQHMIRASGRRMMEHM